MQTAPPTPTSAVSQDSASQPPVVPPTEVRSWWRRHLHWLVLLVTLALGLLTFALDQWALYWLRDVLYAHIRPVVYPLRVLPELLPMTTMLAAFFLLDRKNGRKIALCGLVAVLSASAITSVIKVHAGRHRPQYLRDEPEISNPDRRTVFAGPYKGYTQSQFQSFPSGHAAAIFAFAGVVTMVYPWTALPMLLLACGVAISRICSERHFLSDVYFGAWLGVVCAFNTVRNDWPGLLGQWLRARCRRAARPSMDFTPDLIL